MRRLGKSSLFPVAMAALALTLGPSGTARANEQWFNATADAHVYSGAQNTNYNNNYLYVGDGFDDGKITRSYVKWDITSLQDDIIDGVVIELYCAEKGTTLGVGAHYNPESFNGWTETAPTWNSQSSYAAYAEEADKTSINEAGTESDASWFAWSVTPEAWSSQDSDGILSFRMQAVTEGVSGAYCRFHSSETGFQPLVTITWHEQGSEDLDWEIVIPDLQLDSLALNNPFDGTSLGDFADNLQGLDQALDIAIGPGGAVFVADADSVFAFDQNGVFIRVAVPETAGFTNISGIDTRGGQLFVSSTDGYVAEFDSAYTFAGYFVQDGSLPVDVLFIPGGKALVSDSRPGGGVRLHDAEGRLEALVLAVEAPGQITYSPTSGHYFVASSTSDEIHEFDLAGVVYGTWPFENGRGVYELGNGRLLLTRDDGVWSMDRADPADLVLLSPGPHGYITALPPLKGGCCLGGDCANLTEEDCIDAGGSYLGHDVSCSADRNGNEEPDACEAIGPGADSDGDGVADADDLCALSPLGVAVDAAGCTGVQRVELFCPADTFPEHGQHVSCVAHEANRARDDGLIDQDERVRLVREAAHAK